MIEVKINKTAIDSDLRRDMNSIKKQINFTTIHQKIGVVGIAWIEKNFRDEGTEKKWKELSSGTKYARKATGSKGQSILRVSGVTGLAGSFSSNETDKKVVIGSRDKKVVWHHFGTKPYTIRPKNKKSLFFPSPQGNIEWKGYKWTRTKPMTVIHHPGITARPIFPSEKVIIGIMNDVISDEVSQIKGMTDASTS